MVRAAAKNHAHVGVVVDPADYGDVLAELRADGALSDATRRRLARAAFAHTAAYDAAIVAWLDEDGRRRGRRCPPTLHLAARPGPGPALRREPPPGRAPATALAGEPQLVGRRHPARRQGALVPQPLRRRGGLAAGPRPRRRAGRGGHQARQPLRRGRRRRPRHRLPAGPRVRPGLGLRRHRGRQPAGAGGAGRGAGPGLHRGGRRPGLRGRRARGADGQEEPAGPRGAGRPGPRGLAAAARSTAACSSRPPTASPSTAPTWRVVTEAAPTEERVARPRAGLAGRGPGRRRTPSCW